MIIRGILDKSLSKQTCIRGFARIKELARVSKANKEYQRELIDKQKTVISNFLTEETYLFFPEVILSLKLKYDYTKTGAKRESPLTLIDSKKTFKSNIDGLSIKVIEKKNNKSFDTSSRDDVRIAELEFDETSLNGLIRQKKHPFHRVDGNHRLSAADQLDGDRINMMDVPFCIVLFEEITDQVFDTASNSMIMKTNKDYEKFEKVVFYNINSKTIPLTLEQNLKVLIDDDINFSDNELEKIFGGKHPVKTRELTRKASCEIFKGLQHLLKDNYRTYYNEIFDTLLIGGHDESMVVDEVFESLQAVDQIYKLNEKLKSNNCLGLLTAFVYYHIASNSTQFELFKNWVLNHHIFDLEEATAGSIISIFDKISEKKGYKLFVAMPYWSHSEINEYNNLYKEICLSVSKKANIELDLIPIMRFRGKSQRIDQRLIDKIHECDIFIADITGNNINVIFEVGCAESKNKPMILLKNESDKEPAPFDMDKLQYLPYPDKGYYNDIKTKVIGNLSEILRRDFKVEI